MPPESIPIRETEEVERGLWLTIAGKGGASGGEAKEGSQPSDVFLFPPPTRLHKLDGAQILMIGNPALL